jgi:hypothetical protein
LGAAGAAEAAGAIASSSGSETAADRPFSRVRREIDLFVMNISVAFRYAGFFLS